MLIPCSGDHVPLRLSAGAQASRPYTHRCHPDVTARADYRFSLNNCAPDRDTPVKSLPAPSDGRSLIGEEAMTARESYNLNYQLLWIEPLVSRGNHD